MVGTCLYSMFGYLFIYWDMVDHNTPSAARGDLYVSSANLNYYTRSFQYEGTRIWAVSVDQSNSPQVYLFLKLDIWKTISHSKIQHSF